MKILPLLLLLPFWAGAQTFDDVAPIFRKKCAVCHRPGDAAPFSLRTYEEVTRRATFIKKVISEDYMPPWRADNHYRSFANDRSLSADEKQLILSWIDRKTPPGKKTLPDDGLLAQTAYHRTPDLTLRIDSAFSLAADNKERFIVFRIPFESGQEQAVEAIEFHTNNKKIVHHVNYGFYAVDDDTDIRSGPSVVNTTDDLHAAEQLRALQPLKQKMTYYTGWIPGASVETYPAGFGWTLPKRGVMLVTAHFSAIAAPEESIVGVNLFFRKSPIQRQVRVISLGSGGIGEKDITPPLMLLPGDKSIHRLRVQTQEDQSLLYLWPHMHLLGKEFTAYAVAPSGDTIRLVHIPKWDFRWQELYRLPSLVKIPRGSVVHLECAYDNSVDNPNNPNNPPQAVFSFGDMDSKNEMMTLLMIYTAYRPEDETLRLEP
ncbi:MAG: cytochrome c [Siphonobacter aquaeclarae]|nr:cytochrome c [Siphonobacter aquaeclarae]